MKEIAISKFKANCLGVLERVRRTGEPVLVTKFGKPVAQIVPPPEHKPSKRWVGSMAATAQILGDIVAPGVDESDWEVLIEAKNTRS